MFVGIAQTQIEHDSPWGEAHCCCPVYAIKITGPIQQRNSKREMGLHKFYLGIGTV